MLSNKELINIVTQSTNERVFKDYHYSSARIDAIESLEGRTSYYSAFNLRYFNCKILHCQVIYDGLFLMTIESVSNPYDKVKTFRSVVFDIFGDIVYRPDLDNGFNNKNQALKDFNHWNNSFSALTYYHTKLLNLSEKSKHEYERLEHGFNQLSAVITTITNDLLLTGGLNNEN